MKKFLMVLTAVSAVGLYTASGAYAGEHHKSGNTTVVAGSFNGNFNVGSGNGNGNAGFGNITSVTTQNNGDISFGRR
jgi:hypothetical protein